MLHLIQDIITNIAIVCKQKKNNIKHDDTEKSEKKR